MPESQAHRTVATRIALRYGAEYPPRSGADIVMDDMTIEVETPGNVADGIRQLQGHRGPVYIAGTNQEAVDEALEVTRGTTIGVMDNRGDIVKHSTRRW